MKILVLDAETFDPTLLEYGMGWAFANRFPSVPFGVLGFGYRTHVGELGYIKDTKMIEELIISHNAILCHNAIYDLGALIYLGLEEVIKDKLILDTQLMAKINDQHLISYSLDSLTEKYNLVRKQSDILHEFAWSTGLYRDEHLAETGRNCYARPSVAVLDKWCKQDMRRFPVEVVSEYCLQDVKATYSLYKFLEPKLSYMDLETYSNIIKVCLEIKKNGVKIDLKRARELSVHFKEVAEQAAKTVNVLLNSPEGFNINSTKQLGEALLKKGYVLPRTDKGAPSLKSEWLEEQDDELFTQIRRYRKALKVEKDFIQKLIKYQQIIPEGDRNEDTGWLFPSLKPLGATLTGRFTSGGGSGSLELSIHQIPRRDEEFGQPVRELFLPHGDEKLICCDFSSQESRLQVHYAKLLKCSGVNKIVDAWKQDPDMKYHNKVAELTNLEYDTAKMINLGLSYGMHTKKLSEKIGVSYEEGDRIIKQYHKLLPFMQQLQDTVSRNIKKLGYVRTLGGRKILIDPPYMWAGKMRTNESKGLSKLIQSSAADQCIKSMVLAWQRGLKLLFSVHDEILISSNNPEEDTAILRECMETSFILEVPMVAEAGVGDNWGEAK